MQKDLEKSLNPKMITEKEIETLAKAGVVPYGTPPDVLQVFAISCNQHGLSPFKKEIYLVKYGSVYNNIVGIDGLRTKASRTGQFAGRDNAQFDLMPDGTFKTAAQLKGAKPITCTITVYRAIAGLRCPFTKTVLFAEYCPANASQKWASMPINMIEKCAEAAALRMAFADETAGLLVEEESAAIQDITIQAAQTAPALEIDTEVLRDKIDKCFTADALVTLYASSSLYAEYAEMFTARKNELLEMQKGGQI